MIFSLLFYLIILRIFKTLMLKRLLLDSNYLGTTFGVNLWIMVKRDPFLMWWWFLLWRWESVLYEVRWLEVLSQVVVDMETRSCHRDEVVLFFFLVRGTWRWELAATWLLGCLRRGLYVLMSRTLCVGIKPQWVIRLILKLHLRHLNGWIAQGLSAWYRQRIVFCWSRDR